MGISSSSFPPFSAPSFLRSSSLADPFVVFSFCVVDTDGAPHRIYYEVHGAGPTKILFIMGEQKREEGRRGGEEASSTLLPSFSRVPTGVPHADSLPSAGLKNCSFSWSRQVDALARNPEYSVLVVRPLSPSPFVRPLSGSDRTFFVLQFDNRGAGYSDTPRGPYTTGKYHLGS